MNENEAERDRHTYLKKKKIFQWNMFIHRPVHSFEWECLCSFL